MENSKSKTIRYLVFFIAAAAMLTTIISLFYNKDFQTNKQIQSINGQIIPLYGKGIYRNDSISMAMQAKGQDIVTLFLGIPFLLYSLKLNRKKTLLSKFFLSGILAYFLYTYAIYSFAGSFNPLFILYCTIMGLSFYAFVGCVLTIDMSHIQNHFSSKLPVKYLGISNIIFALLIALNWISRLSPSESAKYLEHYTTLPIQAIDLGIVLPTIIFSSIMFIKKRSWGYLLTPIMTFKIFTLLLAMIAMIIFMLMNGVKVGIADLTIFPIFTLITSFNLYLIMTNIK